jgi:hypothetical protein
MFPPKPVSRFRSFFRKSIAFALCALVAASVVGGVIAHKTTADTNGQSGGEASGDQIWSNIEENAIADRHERKSRPSAYRTVRLNRDALDEILRQAPMEFTDAAKSSQVVLTIPLPDGGFARFLVMESPIMEPALASEFPNIKTYKGQGIDDPTATTRFDLTPTGFHAIVLSANGTFYVEPYARGNTLDYISFNHSNAPAGSLAMECMNTESSVKEALARGVLSEHDDSVMVTSGDTLRSYRVAVGATAEYTATYGSGTVAGALASITTTMNFVIAIYEREVALRMTLVANETSIIYTDTATDGYTTENITALLNENQTKLDTVIGAGNYDIGHVFDGRLLGAGFSFQGQAGSIGNGCIAGSKARGVSIFRSVSPGDVVAYYLVAHEMGHQFGATHTMNGSLTGCGGARTSITAYEPGSGSTIMGYRWNCGAQDLRSADTYFHNASLEQIVSYTTSGGGSCGVTSASGNNPPSVSAGASYTIPRNTPFALTASGSDPNGDPLTYTWEQLDLGAVSPPDTDADGQARPILRSRPGTTNPTRTFPSLAYILNNANVPPTSAPCPFGGGTCLVGESLPNITRTMNFRVTARDGRTTGGINSAAMQVNVTNSSGPFAVTAPNTGVTWAGNSVQTVTWNVVNTDLAPVSAANVRILLSTDGGNTFPVVVNPSTPNDGSESIVVPNIGTTQARIKVEGAGNIFFDISDTAFTIAAVPVATGPDVLDFDGDDKTDPAVVRDSGGSLNWYLQQSTSGFVGQLWGISGDTPVPADYDGDDKWDIAVWRPGSPAYFYILKSSTGTFDAVQFGTTGDNPTVTQDFDGDGKADPAVTRNNGGSLAWYILRSSLGFTGVTFGSAATDVGVRGDFDGDGRADVGIYRANTGSPANSFFILKSSDGTVIGQNFGLSNSDRILPADFDGDGKTDFAVYRFSGVDAGNWYWLRSSDGVFAAVSFGLGSDLPVPGDYDGDGRTDQAVWRAGSPATFYLNRSSTGFTAIPFGTTGDTVPGFSLQAR